MDQSLDLKIKKLAYMSEFLKKEFLLIGQDADSDEETALFMSEIEADLRALLQSKIEKEFHLPKVEVVKDSPKASAPPPFTTAQEEVLRALADNILSKTNPEAMVPKTPKPKSPVPPPALTDADLPPNFAQLPIGERIRIVKEIEKKTTAPVPEPEKIDLSNFITADEE